DDTVAMARFGLNYRFGSGAKAAPYAVDGHPADFSGFQVGVHAGAALARLSQTDVAGTQFWGALDHDSTGMSGGLNAGYIRQDGATLVGLEADFRLTGNRHTLVYEPFFLNQIVTDMHWMASLRARTGLVAGNTLFYLSGGVALARIENRFVRAGAEYFDLSGT